ncbi:hypothetical protein [Cellulomonas sp. KRMCY2]|uniref:hypothetical protein n=1 Tax=Cellulomonas sp. KRMCY2 TaxID=1304865 RepID=UPI00045E8146|nr:hypothetical protein [Cellulomonas sp. KRMCY2]
MERSAEPAQGAAELLAGRSPEAADVRALRARIPCSPIARALLRVFEQDEKTLHHAYRKWRGPHWTLTCLALIDYPPGDEALRSLVRRVHDWFFSEHFLEPPLTVTYPGQDDRVRHCASMDGNAIRTGSTTPSSSTTCCSPCR